MSKLVSHQCIFIIYFLLSVKFLALVLTQGFPNHTTQVVFAGEQTIFSRVIRTAVFVYSGISPLLPFNGHKSGGIFCLVQREKIAVRWVKPSESYRH